MAKSHFTRIVAVLFLFVASANSHADVGVAQPTPAPEVLFFAPEQKIPDYGHVTVKIGCSSYERPKGSLWQQAFAGYFTDWDTRPCGTFEIGYEFKGFRFSYFDLRKSVIDAEAGDDEGAIELCKCVVDGDTDKYYTTSSMRGFSLTYKIEVQDILPWKTLKGFFVEAGPALFRHALHIEKDDGFSFSDKLWGWGHVIGVGFEKDNFTIGLYWYRTKIGGSFNNGEYPSGTGGANVLAIGYKF